MRTAVRLAGRTLIALGTLLLLFVAYQLWGTGIQEARAQDRLRSEFERSLLTTTTTSTTEPKSTSITGGPTTATSTTTTTTRPSLSLTPTAGDPIALLRIPRIGVDKVIVEGVETSDLKKAPGHYPQTPLPGRPGNVGIAGHRTTYGAPFFDLNELEEGDEILLTTAEGEFRYLVDRSLVVAPTRVDVLDATAEARVTLTTCEPRYSARKRLIVSAVLDDQPVEPPPVVAPTTSPNRMVPDRVDRGGGTAVVSEEIAVATPELSGDTAARWSAFGWGAFTAFVALATWLLARRARHWWVYLAGSPAFFLALFVFFERLSEVLPASV